MEMLTTIDQAQLKQSFSRIAASTSVITLVDEQQGKMGFTATTVTSVSVEPPLILVCVNNLSRTVPVFQSGSRFVINLLTDKQQLIGMRFASRDADKFVDVSYTIRPTGALYLNDTLASLECTPHEIYPAGDHHIVIGRVMDIHIGEDEQPLVFFRSRFMA